MSSKMPKDPTPTLGSNYGLDGYPDLEYGAGVRDHGLAKGMGALDAEFLGDNSGAPTVPDGIVIAEDVSEDDRLGDLADFMKDAGITDLEWLDVGEQDLERLPDNPVDDAIPELEEAWSEHEGTRGLHFFANVDPEVARYQASLEAPAENPRLAKSVLREVRHKAMRLSAAGSSWERIANEVQRVLVANGVEHFEDLHSKDAAYLNKSLDLVRSEHGLAGKVFVRAEAYPGYEQGRWAKHLRKVASGAQYIVVPSEHQDVAHIQDGWCKVTSKKVVAAVPWEEARRHYTPKLAATGRSVEATGDARAALKAAFAQAGRTMAQIGDVRPTHVTPSERVSSTAARKALKAAPKETRKLDRKAAELARDLKKARFQVARWVNQGLLTKEQGTTLVADENPSTMLRNASALITKGPNKGEFSGTYNQAASIALDTTPSSRMSADQAKKATEKIKELSESRYAAESRDSRKVAKVKAKVASIAAEIERGMTGSLLRKLIKRTIHADEVEIATPLLDPILRKTGALEERERKTAEFSGPRYTAQPISRTANLTPGPREIQSLLRWAKTKLNEGSMGEEFDQLLKLRFAKGVRKAAAKDLQALRDEHEGLAGNLYVDASAYASKTGTEGCEKGALQHRSNGIRHVMAMDRCAGCAFANKRADGTAICQKYNKALITEAPVEDRRAFQSEAIRMANASDAEQTASLFAASYDPSEFDLSNGTLEGFDYSHTPVEKLSGIWYGGMDIDLKED